MSAIVNHTIGDHKKANHMIDFKARSIAKYKQE